MIVYMFQKMTWLMEKCLWRRKIWVTSKINIYKISKINWIVQARNIWNLDLSVDNGSVKNKILKMLIKKE